jgi:hypothetical protein
LKGESDNRLQQLKLLKEEKDGVIGDEAAFGERRKERPGGGRTNVPTTNSLCSAQL